MRAAAGFRVHSGWAAAVTVAGEKRWLEIVDRRRIELADGTPGSKQPYHAAERLPAAGAEAHLARCRKSTSALARHALEEIVGAHPIGACGMLLASGRPLPELTAILASHALIHSAEGEFFRQAITGASVERGLPVRSLKERELLATCVSELKLSPDKLQQRLTDWGRVVGPPWRQDEKFAALAAWLALVRLS